MASLQSQSQSEPQRWNKLPPEILGLILSNLGKHDLLNARMVSHALNDESLKVLRKSTFTQVLTEENITEYIGFAKPIGPRPFIIPFHLNLKIYILSSAANNLKTLSSYIDSLCQIFGPQCVSRFTLTTRAVGTNELDMEGAGLIEFLGLISPGLKTLDLTGFNSTIHFLHNQNITKTFPNLKRLIGNTEECAFGRSGLELMYISIIESSPKLEHLTLTHPCDLESWPLNFNQLKSLSLDTMLKPQNILNIILASSGTPVLREFSYAHSVSWTADEKIVVYNILQSFSTTLKSLRLREPMIPSDFGTPRIMRLPKLPYLEHLGLEYNTYNRYWLNAEDVNLSQETFPSLISIELPIGFIFTPPPSIDQCADENDYVRIQFPNLIKLTLRVTYIARPKELNETLERLQEIFPNVSKLSLVDVGGCDTVKYLLDRIMISNWSKNIEEFEMIGFTQDYLGQVLDRLEISLRIVLEKCDGILGETIKYGFERTMREMKMECEETVLAPGSIILTRSNKLDSIKMTSITTVKLELVDVSSPAWSSPESIPNLTGFVKHFPQLRMIEVSQLLLPQMDKNMQRGFILKFKSKFPGVILYFT